jgi:cell division protein FtsI/penicillin-binding protein 2
VIGAILGAGHGSSPDADLARAYVRAWTRAEWSAMYQELDTPSQRRVSAPSFADGYRAALRMATATDAVIAGRAHGLGGEQFAVPVRVHTRLFGTLSLEFDVAVSGGSEGPRVRWSRSLLFPGLRPGEKLARRLQLPRRATLLARDGSVLAEGNPELTSGETTRESPIGDVGASVIGTVGPAPSSRRESLESEGVPGTAVIGLSGLERALDARLRGRPGGALLAGRRLLAYIAPKPAPPVRTSISPELQSEAVTALAGRLGAVVAMVPQSGQVLAVAGIGLDGLQPPGSTFKMITLAAVLKAKLATPRTVFPYATHATLDGVELDNANGEECGGSLELAFAVSCNSVFTPLGVRLGATRLVAMAELFGFNSAPGLAGAAESTLPPATEIQGELAVGSTAIGQGEVLATPLQMAIVAATIADAGRRPTPTFLASAGVRRGPVAVSAAEARTIRHLMTGVVRFGTGRSAAIPGVTVAGKTGTAELKSGCTPEQEADRAQREAEQEGEEETESDEVCASATDPSNTDAWFASFAPATRPRIVVSVLLVKDGAGGDTAAPLAREVLETGLKAAR